MTSERHRRLALLSVFILAVAVHLNSLGNGFALDDVAIIETNEQVHGIDRLDEALEGSYWPGGHSGRGLFRPLTLATYAVNWEAGDGDPFSFHLVNVLLHAVATALVLQLLLVIGAGLPGAWAGAALFAVHPVHVEAVANVVGRAEILVAVFFLSAAILYARKSRRGWGVGAAVAVLYFLGLASKEHAVMLPAVLLGLDLLEQRRVRPAVRAALASWRVYVLLGATLATYFAVRREVLGVFLGMEIPAWFWGMGPAVRWLTAIRVWPEYLRLMLVPVDLVPDYGPGVIIPETSLLAPLVLLGLATAAVAALVAWRAWSRQPLVSAGIVWFALTVLPVAGLLFPVEIILAERTLYLPSVGLALAVAALAGWAASHDRWRPAAALFGIVLAAAAVRTWTANPIWRGSDTVIEHLLEHHPTNFRGQWALGSGLRAKGDTAAALDHMELATRMVPGYYGLRVEYGQLLAATGELDRATAQLDTALQIFPAALNGRLLKIETLITAGRPNDAARAAAEGIRHRPDDADLLAVYARALGRAGDPAAAARARRRSIELRAGVPSWAEWGHLAGMAFLAGDTAATRFALGQARELATEDVTVPSIAELGAMIEEDGPATIPLW